MFLSVVFALLHQQFLLTISLPYLQAPQSPNSIHGRWYCLGPLPPSQSPTYHIERKLDCDRVVQVDKIDKDRLDRQRALVP
ncbi:hypothetical protein BDZ91DRAFT_716897 [Kalaharituber pfeilii]|nr:hypothetical protein BDZ91DRAFT_716897 [Kalaharituber pfeilii]